MHNPVLEENGGRDRASAVLMVKLTDKNRLEYCLVAETGFIAGGLGWGC